MTRKQGALGTLVSEYQQRAVIALVGLGLNHRQIAYALQMSPSTVSRMRNHIAKARGES